MLIKFETKSMRVKGISFHPSRPWVLTSLHSGVIQLWDYKIRTQIDRFDEHSGPVRGVAFHSTQPLFVSGGDDYKIKVWNYKSRKCLFTLTKHLDYVRTVQFHEVNPWIVSASDDQTIRIWNWQSRTCIATLTGHNHYVMCASFHPKEDLVISASLDQTVRVWDISGLRQKNSAPTLIPDDPNRQADRMFGQDDAVVKFVLEGHDRGVNWASFCPSMPYIVSGADDRLIKIWRMNEDRVWEIDQLRGHFNNVSCVIFHPRQEIILSNSEDKTIRVWDLNKRVCLHTYRREHDRFWVLAAHPKLNMFGAGHDGGLIVFKLEKERQPYELVGKKLYFLRDRYLRVFDLESGRESALQLLSRSGNNAPGLGKGSRRIAYNAAESALLVSYDGDGSNYELYRINREGSSAAAAESEVKKGTGVGVFVARNRFALLIKGQNKLVVKNIQNEVTKTVTIPDGARDIFFCGVGRILIHTDDKMILFDIQMKKTLAELPCTGIKHVVWSGSDADSLGAFVARDAILIVNRRMEQLSAIHETIKIKSAAWDPSGVLYYTTLNHIKYCLSNGDSGIIRTLDIPLYLAAVRKDTFYCVDRDSKIRMVGVDLTESTFKLALMQRQFDKVMSLVKGSNLIGQAIISYLQEKGFPELALHFARDEPTRFKLALECGNIEVALQSARALEDPSAWNKLAVAALRQGNHQVVEMAYQKTKQFERLSFLYLITGNIVKLRRMLEIAEARKDIMGRFQNSLMLGDVPTRLNLLKGAGRDNLAYVTATIHGLEYEMEADEEEEKPLPNLPRNPYLLFPPTPITRQDDLNWPVLTVTKGFFNVAPQKEASRIGGMADELEVGGETGGWGDDDIAVPDEGKAEENGFEDNEDGGEEAEPNVGGGDGWDDLEIPEELETAEVPAGGSSFIVPHPGPPIHQIWSRFSPLAVDHVAAGSFESAMSVMNSSAGIVNFAPLRSMFMSIYSSSRVPVATLPSIPTHSLYLQRGGDVSNKTSLPLVPTSLQSQIDRLKGAYRATFEGKFTEALAQFQSIIQYLLFLSLSSPQEVNEVKELLGICREYTLGLLMELKRKEDAASNPDPTRQVELSAYFTHCNLQPVHLILALRSAMNTSYKAKNFQMATTFARRLLELNPKNDVATQARKVMKFCERNQVDQIKVNYDFRNPFVICAGTFVPIYQGTPLARCPYCSATYAVSQKGLVCSVCDIAEIGKDCSGYVWVRS